MERLDPGARVYTASGIEDAEIVEPISEDDHLALMSVQGRPLTSEWKPPSVRVVTVDHRGAALKRCSFPWHTPSILFLRPEAVAALGDLIPETGELLPVAASEDLAIWNVTAFAEGALDLEQSEVTQFLSGKIMQIKRYEFVPRRIANLETFRIAEAPTELCFSQHFVDRMRRTDLVGLDFRLRWTASKR
jgi:hypothetical protein